MSTELNIEAKLSEDIVDACLGSRKLADDRFVACEAAMQLSAASMHVVLAKVPVLEGENDESENNYIRVLQEAKIAEEVTKYEKAFDNFANQVSHLSLIKDPTAAEAVGKAKKLSVSASGVLANFCALANLRNKTRQTGTAAKKRELMGDIEQTYRMILEDDIPVHPSIKSRLSQLFPTME